MLLPGQNRFTALRQFELYACVHRREPGQPDLRRCHRRRLAPGPAEPTGRLPGAQPAPVRAGPGDPELRAAAYDRYPRQARGGHEPEHVEPELPG